MTTALAKGGNLVLSAEAPGIERVRVGLGWNAGPGPDAPELDGFASIVEEGSSPGRLLLAHQVPNPEEPLSARPAPAGPVVGDAAKLVVTLDAVPAATTRLLFGAAIYDATRRRQSFRAVTGAYIRVLNDADGLEIARYSLGEHTGPETAMVFGELYRNPRGWKFRAVGQGYSDGLRGVAGGAGDPPSARPGEVSGYLRRRSAARTRRTLWQHLEPSGPAPSQPAPSQPPPPKPPPAAAPPEPPTVATPPRPDPPARPAPPSRPATPAPVGGLDRGALDLGALDLGAPAAAPPARAGGVGDPPTGTRSRARTGPAPTREPAPSTGERARGTGAATVVVGEHSSRHRQRTEHVDVLDDDHPATTWTETDRGTGGMTLTLTWEVLQTSTGLPRPSDLHLAVLWQSDDRASGLMQTMDGSTSAPGPLARRQVLRLGRRDEREGQTVYVDLTALHTFRRFVLLVYGQHGSPEWAALRPVLTAGASTGEQLAIRLGEAPPSARVCLLASFHVDEDDLVIRREADFVDGGLAEIAPRFGWDLEWGPDGMTLRSTR